MGYGLAKQDNITECDEALATGIVPWYMYSVKCNSREALFKHAAQL